MVSFSNDHLTESHQKKKISEQQTQKKTSNTRKYHKTSLSERIRICELKNMNYTKNQIALMTGVNIQTIKKIFQKSKKGSLEDLKKIGRKKSGRSKLNIKKVAKMYY